MCGARVEASKVWTMVAPLPDSLGRLTVTVMGSFKCPQCGKSWRAVISKLKVGGGEVEVSGKTLRITGEERSRGEVIELDVESILSERE